MNLDEMIRLIQAVSASSLCKFDMEEGSLKLSMITDKMPTSALFNMEKATDLPASVTQPAGLAAPTITASGLTNLEDTAPVVIPATVTPAIEMVHSDKIVKSPLVGTFYNASSPEAAPFAQVGDKVKKGQVLGIIEAMKLMNEIESEFDGVVDAILVENEQVVEYGQPLFRIR